MRLIDGDALYRKTAAWEAQALHVVKKTMNYEDKTEWKRWSTILAERSEFKFDVADAPTVDAVPVVRCKYCKHRPTKPDDYNPITTDGFALEFPDEKCPCKCGDGWYSKYPDDDWYCPIGERKGGDER